MLVVKGGEGLAVEGQIVIGRGQPLRQVIGLSVGLGQPLLPDHQHRLVGNHFNGIIAEGVNFIDSLRRYGLLLSHGRRYPRHSQWLGSRRKYLAWLRQG